MQVQDPPEEELSLSDKSRLFLKGSVANNKQFLRTTFLGFLFLSLVGIYGYSLIATAMKEEMRVQLSESLESTRSAVHLWVAKQKGLITMLLRDPGVHKPLLQLLKENSGKGSVPRSQEPTGRLDGLRLALAPVMQQQGWVDILVIDAHGVQVGSLMNTVVERQKFSNRGTFFQRSLDGETVVSLPFGVEPSGTAGQPPLPNERDTAQFVSAPIWDDKGNVAGVFAIRLDPASSFYKLFERSRRGLTGESYIFDLSGLMLSDSRFEAELKMTEKIRPHPDSRARFQFRVCKPLLEHAGGKDSAHCELTTMASGAVQGQSGVEVDGVADYRGVTVVGAWAWLEEPGVGLIIKMDESEAYSTLTLIRHGYLAIFGSLAITILLALIFRLHQGQTELIQKHTQKKLEVSEERTQSVISNAIDGIVTFGETGLIDLFNPSAERIFGYRSEDVLGKSIYILLDTDSQDKLRETLQDFIVNPNYRSGWSRELNGRTQGGETVNLELAISQMMPHGVRKFIGIFRNITERKLNQIRINRLHRQNELILSSVGEGIFGMDLEGRISFINPAAEKLLGYEPDELIGEPAHLILHPPIQPWTPQDEAEHNVYLPLKDKVTCLGKEPNFWGKDGLPFPVEFSSTSIIEEDEIVGAVVTFRNIFARIQAENALKNYALDLEKMNEELQNFTFVASHDLQEPLRKVMTLSDLLQSSQWKKLDKKGKDYLERIQNSVVRMQQLIYDLLDYFQSTSEDSTFETIDLDEEVRSILASMEDELHAAKAEYSVEGLPVIKASPFQIRKLFQHLISNAIKFKRKRTPLKLQIMGERSDKGHWTIRVIDNGIGFEVKYLDRIFRPFQRLHERNSYSGSGIGLAICEKIVARHRGTITAHSKPRQGAQFIITLPQDLTQVDVPSLR